MEVAESRDTTSVGPPAGADSTATNGEHNPYLDDSLIDDDGRSSSLSEIDDLSENIPSDYESPKPEQTAPDNDSEAETERIEESPNNLRSRTNIVVSAGNYGPSPSKLAQSTTYDDVEDDDEPVADDSPTKPRTKSSRVTEPADEIPSVEDSALSESFNKKRKRLESGDDVSAEIDEEDEPPQKRRGSVKSELSDPPAEDIALSPEPVEEPTKPLEDDTPADDVPESDLPAPPAKGKKTKKGKRKTRKTRDADEEVDGAVETGAEGGADDNLGDDDAERGEEADDGEAAAKLEEECKSWRSSLILAA